MPTFNGNDIHLTWGGTDIAGEWQEVTLGYSNEDVDTTAGAGKEYKEVAPGLTEVTASLTIVYDETTVDTIRALFTPGTIKTLIVGPEGNTSGKPKHEQDFKCNSAPFTQSVQKGAVAFEVSLMSTGAPAANFWGGGTF